MNIPNIFRTILSAPTLVFCANALQRGAAIILISLAIARLSPVEVGVLTYIYSSATALSSFLGDAFASVILRSVKKNRQGSDGTENSNLRLSVELLVKSHLMALLMAIFVFLILGALLPVSQSSNSLPAFFLSFLVISNAFWYSMIARYGSPIYASIGSLCGSLVILILAIINTSYLTAYFYLWLPVFGFAISNAIYVFWGFRNRFIQSLITPNGKWVVNREQNVGLWKTITSLSLGGPIHWLCLSMLYRATDGVAQTAIFSAWFQWYLVLTFFPSAAMQITIPWILGDDGSKESSCYKVHQLIKWYISVGVVLFVLFIFFIDEIIAYYPTAYASAKFELILAFCCGIGAGLGTMLTHSLLAIGKAAQNLTVAICYSTGYLGFVGILVGYFGCGALGMYVAIFISLCCQLVMQYRYISSGDF